jgi:hypothetical protein
MLRVLGVALLVATLSTPAIGQGAAPLSPESKNVMTKLKMQKVRANRLILCLPKLKRCDGAGSHGGAMSICCKQSESCGQTDQGIPYCR